MTKCEQCGKRFRGKTARAKYCSPNCRLIHHRLNKAAAAAERYEGLVDRLRLIAPAAAASVEKLVDLQGLTCGEAAVRLALAAYTEGVRAAR